MTTRELLARITSIPIFSTGLSKELLAGDFSSIFKGQGMEFDEIRHYQIGDDVRSIDWNTSARFGTPYVKMYKEERELNIMILLDVSASMLSFGMREGTSPFELGLITAALIAFSAEKTGQRVGAFFFNREIERAYPPKKGGRHIMAFLTAALKYHDEAGGSAGVSAKTGSNIAAALNAAGHFLKRRSLVILISDFYSIDWERSMEDMGQRHDCVAIRIGDPLENKMPDMGLISIEDPETGLLIEAPANMNSFQEAWSRWHDERSSVWAGQCRRCGVSYLELTTCCDPTAQLLKFFGSRREKT